jgi:D-alanine transfer protein
MLSKLIRFHLIPILIALVLTSLFVYGVSIFPKASPIIEVINVEGTQIKHRGKYLNLLGGEQAEIDLFASIKNPNQLTVFGSSELSLSKYASYHFLPDSMGMAAMGFGHAEHQSLSILIELLAAKEYLKGSDICIILSPVWFSSTGTNVEAFIEFARPNLSNKILHDSSISDTYKKHIGRFIHRHYDEINGVTNSMEDFRNLYLVESNDYLGKVRLNLSSALIGQRNRVNTSYTLRLTDDTLSKTWGGNFEDSRTKLSNEFVSGISNNEIFVNDEYFENYLLKLDGGFDKRALEMKDLNGLDEYAEFLFVLQLLEENKVNASFIMQPFNPYFYDGLVEYQEVIHQITTDLDRHHFPYLNMYISDTEDYVPGTLKDVQHLGDVGWMTINEFLISVYHE